MILRRWKTEFWEMACAYEVLEVVMWRLLLFYLFMNEKFRDRTLLIFAAQGLTK